MKKNVTIIGVAMLLSTATFAQSPINCNASNCTTNSTIDQCSPNSPNVVTNFQNKTQKSGNPCGTGLCVNSVWRYSNVATVSGQPIDVEIKVVAISNAILADMDDDAATDQNGNSIASFFAPRISPDVSLNNTSRRGYVEFEIKFYHRTNPTFTTLSPMTGLNFVHYDIDGSSNANGWFRELGDVKIIPGVNNQILNPTLSAASGTELTLDGGAGGGWHGFLGSTCERTGVSRCAEVAVAANYTGAQSTLNFRMGYDFDNGYNVGQPIRQYGARFGCFDFPGGGPLPVTVTGLGVNYKSGMATLHWTAEHESNMKGYTIERSLDGIYFDNIGFMGAKNQWGLTQQYQFGNDISAIAQNVVYYRLHMVDIDGKARYSNVVSVRKDKKGGVKMDIVPNPANDMAQLKIEAAASGKGSLVITDASGRRVLQQAVSVAAGNNSILLNSLATLSTGIYTVKVMVGNEVFTDKLIIRN
jgi:hypothetical protein